jgi:TatD DNase family protein
MQLIDTHVHLNFDVFQENLNLLQTRWQEAGVVRLIHSCVEPGEFQSIKALADRFPELYFSVGLHPLDAHLWNDLTFEQIIELASSDARVVAIGEMGLDFYKAENKEQQKLVFEAQLKIALKLNKPVIIHCRDAASSLQEILVDFGQTRGNVGGVMHCWGGTPEETKTFLDLGFYISFSGIVTFKNAQQLREAAAIVPSDRLLIETDCPFLAPNPKRGKTNEPAYVRYVAECLAAVRQVSLEELAEQTTENACKLFGISLGEESTATTQGKSRLLDNSFSLTQ